MSNKTDPNAKSIHGTNPQNLIEKITRNKIYNSVYWKEHCFGLTAETLVDRAIDLDHIGGTYGGNRKPTKFLCLVLKMLQIQPEKEIVVEFIKNEDYKYVRALGAFYMRLVGRAIDVYQYLEPLYNDYRKIRYRNVSGAYELTHIDEFIDQLLTEDFACDTALPFLQKRITLEELDVLEPRVSVLEDELELEDDEAIGAEAEAEDESALKDKNNSRESKKSRSRSRSRSPSRRKRARSRSRSSSRDRDSRKRRDRRSRSRSRDRDRERRRSRSRSRSRDRDSRRDRDRYRKRSRSRSPDRSRSRRSRSRSRSRDRDRERRKDTRPSRDDKKRPTSGKDREGQSSGGGGGDGTSLSIAETNKLRAELGLKPLKG